MVSTERRLPADFDVATSKNIKWSAELGSETHSTPIIAGGRVYIGTNNGQPRDPKHQGDRGVMMCFDERTGKFLWQLVVPKREEDVYFDWPKSGIASPATVEGDRLYLDSNRGEVMCLDAQGMSNGNDGPFRGESAHMTPTNSPSPIPVSSTDADIIWLFNLTTGAGIWSHDAAHTSILIHGDYLYLNTSTGVDNTHKRIRTPDAPSLVVLDKKTGQFVARDNEHIAPNIFHNTWCSPSLAEVNGHPLIFFGAGNGILYAFDTFERSAGRPGPQQVRTGDPRQNTLHDPIAIGAAAGRDGPRSVDRQALTSSNYHRAETAHPPLATLHKVWQFDFDPTAPKTNVHKYNSNRQQSPSNFYGMPVFHHNRIYIAGGGDIWWGKNEAWLKCIDATLSGDITTNGLVWSYPLHKHVLSTAAVYNGMVFIADCGRTFHCVNAIDGKPIWTHEIKGDVWASPLVADGKVYLGTRSGAFYVFAAEKEKKVLSEIDLHEPISSTATAANGVLYVATMSQLYAVQQPVP